MINIVPRGIKCHELCYQNLVGIVYRTVLLCSTVSYHSRVVLTANDSCQCTWPVTSVLLKNI